MYEAFADFGQIQNLHMNLDRRTGYAKGYAMVQYDSFEEAKTAIERMNGQKLLGKPIEVDFAFKKPMRFSR